MDLAASKRRKAAQDLSKYKSLIASPTSLGSAAAGASLTAFKLLANSEYAVSINAVTVAQDISLNYGTRSIKTSGGAADKLFKIGRLERGRNITITRAASCPAGTLKLYVLDEWERPRLIATGTFS